MSRFHGPQGRGAESRARELRMYQAYLRQVDGNLRRATVRGESWAYADPADFLSRDALEQLQRGNLDIDSFRPQQPAAKRLLRQLFGRRGSKKLCEDCGNKRIYRTSVDAYAAALRVSRGTGFRVRVFPCPHGRGLRVTIHTRRRAA